MLRRFARAPFSRKPPRRPGDRRDLRPPQAPPGPGRGAGQDIIVTGSRISRRDFQSDSPISTINSSVIAASGQPSLDRAIGELPQFAASQGASEVGDAQGSLGFSGRPVL